MAASVRVALWALVAGVVLLVVDLGARLPLSGTLVDVLYHGVEVGATLVCAWRAHAERRERGVWLLLAAGLACYAAGDLYYTLFLDGGGAATPYPSLADAGYLAIYPFTYAALVRLIRVRAPRLPFAVWVDGLIVALTVAASGAALLVPAIAAETGGRALTVASNLAYPLGDLILLALVLGVAVLGSWRIGRTWTLLAIGFVTFAGVDVIYLMEVARDTYVSGTLLDAGWPVAFAIIALAAWQPPAVLPALRTDRWIGLAVPSVCAAVSLGLLVADHFDRQAISALVLAAAALAAVDARLLITFGDKLRLLHRTQRDAATDPLTGLRNRRTLVGELEDALASGRPHVLAIFDLDGFKSYNDRFGHAAGDALLVRLSAAAAAAVPGRGRMYRMGGDEFCLLLPGSSDDERATVEAARDGLSDAGLGFVVGCSHGCVDLPGETTAAGDALRIADDRMYAQKHRGRPAPENQGADLLFRALNEREDGCGHDLLEVARRAEATARALGLDDRTVVVVRRASELHDVGKLAIPDAILDKPGPLDEAEWTVMRKHTLVGERILNGAPSLEAVARLVRSSHERFDGAGYPDGLIGDEIPLGARIVAVCDAYDAMRTDRPYRPGRSHALALAELRRCAGSQFDPAVVSAFCAIAEPSAALAA